MCNHSYSTKYPRHFVSCTRWPVREDSILFEALGNALGCVGESGAWPQAGRRAIDQAWNSYWGEVLISSRKDSVNSSRQSAIAAWSSAMAVAPSARVPSSSTQYDCSGD